MLEMWNRNVDKRHWSRTFIGTSQEEKKRERSGLNLIYFALAEPGWYSFSGLSFEDRCFREPAGDNVIVWPNGQENEHFLRFNSPHNCWKETKLSAVNTGAFVRSRSPMCRVRRASRAARHLLLRATTLADRAGGLKTAALVKAFWFARVLTHVCFAGKVLLLIAPKGREPRMCHVLDCCEGSPAALDDKM